EGLLGGGEQRRIDAPVPGKDGEEQREHRHVTEDEYPHPFLAGHMTLGAPPRHGGIGGQIKSGHHSSRQASCCSLIAFCRAMNITLNQMAKATRGSQKARMPFQAKGPVLKRSEEHTSELQSRENLVCRLLLEKKNKE